jgi:hypothetical protein
MREVVFLQALKDGHGFDRCTQHAQSKLGVLVLSHSNPSISFIRFTAVLIPQLCADLSV